MVETRLLLKQRTFKDKNNLPLARHTRLASAANHTIIHRQSLKQAGNQSSKSFNIKHDQRFKHPSMKTNLNYKEGPKIQKFGEKSFSCNNWRLPGEPRSLGDYSLSGRLFNHKCTYRILPSIWISQMTKLCTFNH